MSRVVSYQLIGLALLVGCIPDPPEGGSSADRIARHVSTTAPEPEHELGAVLEGKVELVGYDVEPDEPETGSTVTITWHWRSIEALDEGYQIFTHLVDAETGRMCSGCNFDTTSTDGLRAGYSPSHWKAGEFIADEQRIVLPEKIPFAEAELRLGIFKGLHRLRIVEGPRDGENRVRGFRFSTGYEPPPLPELEVPRATGPIEIDGRLNDAAWARAARTGAYVNATDGEAGRPRTRAKLLYDDENLYLGYECDDDHIHSTFQKRDDHLWKQDAMEVFIDPPAKGRDYMELQVSPAGKLFDTLVHEHPRRDDSWDAKARVAAHIVKGTLNDDSDVDRRWTAELAIPLSSLSKEPVELGARWRLNLFRLDDRVGGRRAFLAWSPPLSNTTHVPDRFGVIVFGPEPGAETASAAAEDAADGGAVTGEAAPAEALPRPPRAKAPLKARPGTARAAGGAAQ